ncbi:MAG: hypothetical protein K6G22_12895 [Lachnospiraceae bacterium]|nr:hypothetical protein [Lachnospiraceae bacterium]
MGYIYYYGFDTDIDYEKAYKYFSMAALQGSIEATYKTGDMFRYGYYVEKSPAVAYVLYNKAFEMSKEDDDCLCTGNIMKRMGDLFYEGIGCSKDPRMAMLYYQYAEMQFYRQIYAGDPYVQKDLDYVVKMQGKLRKQIVKNLPPMEWRS